jgi:hypothetical protein
MIWSVDSAFQGENAFELDASQGILNEVWKNKLIFVETPDANETSIALENYRRVSSISWLHSKY